MTEVSRAVTRALVTAALMTVDDEGPLGVRDAVGGGAGRPELKDAGQQCEFRTDNPGCRSRVAAMLTAQQLSTLLPDGRPESRYHIPGDPASKKFSGVFPRAESPNPSPPAPKAPPMSTSSCGTLFPSHRRYPRPPFPHPEVWTHKSQTIPAR